MMHQKHQLVPTRVWEHLKVLVQAVLLEAGLAPGGTAPNLSEQGRLVNSSFFFHFSTVLSLFWLV